MTPDKTYHQNWPKDVPKHIEIPRISLDEYLKTSAKNFPNAIATTYFGVSLSYEKLNEIVNRISTKFLEMGIEKGDTIALHFSNVPPLIACYYAALRAGAVVTLLSPLFQRMEIKTQLLDSDAKLLVLWEGFDRLDEPVISETRLNHIVYSSLTNWFDDDPMRSDLITKNPDRNWLENIIIEMESKDIKVDIDPEVDVACLQYTGGTTGLPKAAKLTHNNLVANCEQISAWFPGSELGKEVLLTVLPLYHIYAQTTAMNYSMKIAANQILVSNPREIEEVIDAIEQSKVTIFPGVPSLYNSISNFERIEQKNLKSIKYCVSGSAPLPSEIRKSFEKLTGSTLREGYGLTECSPVVLVNPLQGKSKEGSVGLPLPNTEIKIVSHITGIESLGPNEIGELLIKGPQVMEGYFKQPEETRKAIIDGWFYTGDLALIDEDGYTFIKARIKNLIKYKSHSVYPAEIENLLFDHEAIADCAVIGIPDKEVGENIKAFVVLKDSFKGKVTEKGLIQWASDNIASYKYPRIIQFIEEIPKTNTGKILHRNLKNKI